jgi:hypothetical protein
MSNAAAASESRAPCFQPGDRVRVQLRHPPGHIRTPMYLRGKTGVIDCLYGAFPNPEELAFGKPGLPAEPLYRVRFPMNEVWHGDGAYGAEDTVTADLYQHWLDPVG